MTMNGQQCRRTWTARVTALAIMAAVITLGISGLGLVPSDNAPIVLQFDRATLLYEPLSGRLELRLPNEAGWCLHRVSRSMVEMLMTDLHPVKTVQQRLLYWFPTELLMFEKGHSGDMSGASAGEL